MAPPEPPSQLLVPPDDESGAPLLRGHPCRVMPPSHPPLAPRDAQMLRQGRDLAKNQPGFASVLPPLLPWQNLQRRSILPQRGLAGIACAVFMAALIKYAPQSAPHTTLLPEMRLGCNVPSPSGNVTAAVLGNL